MAQKYQGEGAKKIDMAIETMQTMNKAIPELDYTSAMFLFSPFEATVQPGAYSKAKLARGVDAIGTDFDIFNRRTTMGNNLMDVDPVVAGLSGKTALIIFTDGNSNLGADPIAQILDRVGNLAEPRYAIHPAAAPATTGSPSQ